MRKILTLITLLSLGLNFSACLEREGPDAFALSFKRSIQNDILIISWDAKDLLDASSAEGTLYNNQSFTSLEGRKAFVGSLASGSRKHLIVDGQVVFHPQSFPFTSSCKLSNEQIASCEIALEKDIFPLSKKNLAQFTFPFTFNNGDGNSEQTIITPFLDLSQARSIDQYNPFPSIRSAYTFTTFSPENALKSYSISFAVQHDDQEILIQQVADMGLRLTDAAGRGGILRHHCALSGEADNYLITCNFDEDGLMDYKTVQLEVDSFASPIISFELLPADEDSDGDGHNNDSDNCILHGNPDQLDSDYDGAGDACDETRNPLSADGLRAHAPTEDFDRDSKNNLEDNCPLDSNEDQADEDSDGIGDICDEVAAPELACVNRSIMGGVGSCPPVIDSNSDTPGGGPISSSGDSGGFCTLNPQIHNFSFSPYLAGVFGMICLMARRRYE